jgi:hypothetical protein
VNGTASLDEEADLRSLDGRVQVQQHRTDKGLYNNFRSCLDPAYQFHAFFAEDDSWSGAAVDEVLHDAPPTSALILPSVIRKRIWRNGDFVGEPLAPLQLEPDTSSLLRGLDPSWIFGVWRSAFLLKHWPARPFDWLDYYLIFRALSEERTHVAKNSRNELTLGVTPGKIPHAVGRQHASVRLALALAIFAARQSLETKMVQGDAIRHAVAALRRGFDLNRRFNLGNKGWSAALLSTLVLADNGSRIGELRKVMPFSARSLLRRA